jgi:hypothetical protein
MSIESKLVAIEALIASIRAEGGAAGGSAGGAAGGMNISAPIYVKKTSKRFTADSFMDYLYKNSRDKTFADGVVRRTVGPTIPRAKWPLDMDGNEYPKLQDLCADFRIDCMRDRADHPTVYVVLPNDTYENDSAEVIETKKAAAAATPDAT